ncbi:DegT/DnrJ/EryC1/StrS family aminotransferase [Paludicola sp. MB14-C6]|uniref:DegT/DnrJ/EryC1/StrS family aminotransferase n=1 Tax=Paludihabitans sp. MB14-C6 TaxID=3070656 RepID=UPI0027DD0651|nr:DegT/DnrJ/EryC1/StrS family aminotransferase [Paludicola sp. MB14-C6]WMJ24270.1 DegT/DnrJ/EryC1/StrS family aminotransferase [Paludicola sp. MB14-C6]
MKIPLLDLQRQYQNIKQEADTAVCEVLTNAHYIMGENVLSFEKEFADYVGVKHAISVGNGTDALVIALKAMGIGKDDEVITTPYTFFATAEAISFVGATPVFVDVRLDTYNIDETKIEEKITSKTKAIMPVHIFGQCAEMDAINAIAKKHGLLVIEDACQAAGAEYNGKKAGSLADMSCFSFFPTKNLGCAGDGGMICTDNDDLAIICKALKIHGSGEMGEKAYNLLHHIEADVEEDTSTDNTIYNPKKYYNYLIGHNSRLDETQAALLRIKLRHLDTYIQNRRAVADRYNNAFAHTNLVTPKCGEKSVPAYHLYILQFEDREKIVSYLAQNEIATGTYYPVPLHLQKCYTSLGYKKGDMPNAEYLSERTFAIPMFPELTQEEADFIITTIKKAIES